MPSVQDTSQHKSLPLYVLKAESCQEITKTILLFVTLALKQKEIINNKIPSGSQTFFLNVPSQHGKIFTENNYSNIDYIQSPHEF